jgi:hypothetical protein
METISGRGRIGIIGAGIFLIAKIGITQGIKM